MELYPPSATVVGALLLASFVALKLVLQRRIPKGLSLPPGPPRKFIFGNTFDLPSHHEWETYHDWYKKYGDIVYLETFGTSMVYINSAELAYELFEKRSLIYSDRPRIHMFDLIDSNWVVTWMNYGEWWRRHRQVIHQKFNTNVAARYKPLQLQHARSLVGKLIEHPNEFVKYIRHTVGAVIMEVTYDIKILPDDDPYILTAEKVVQIGAEVGTPGSYLVNTMPILKYIPEWLPGAGFKRKARMWRDIVWQMPTAPFDVVKQTFKSGVYGTSITSTLLQELSSKEDSSQEDEDVIRNAAGTVYAGGADTISTTLHIFVLAMILYPEVQSIAQQELDKVVGSRRLPSFSDQADLPYINAICKEVLRWHPVMPSGAPHRLMQDDIVGKYFLPAGTVVFGNTWTLLHSESQYGPDPQSFKPERFMDPDMKSPSSSFGYGRRVCPGRPMAENALFIFISSILHVFNITAQEDSPVNHAFTSGLFTRPVPFECTFTPRSVALTELVTVEGGDDF